MDTPAETATNIAAEIRNDLALSGNGLESVVKEIQEYRSTHSSKDFADFYRDLNFELMRDDVLPELLITGYEGDGIEVHPITEELNKDMLLAGGSTKYDAIAREVEQRYRDIVQLSSLDPTSAVFEFDLVYESAKADLLPLSDIERSVYSTMLRNIILANPDIAEFVDSNEINTSDNGYKFREIINGADITILSTDPNQSDEQIEREQLRELIEKLSEQQSPELVPYQAPAPTLEPFGTWT